MQSFKAGRFKWRRLFPKWAPQLLVNPADPSSGTWLDSRWSKGLGVGCKCCNAAGIDTPFGTYTVASATSLQAVNFKKHAANNVHRLASAAFLGGVADKALHCPQVGEFEKAAMGVVHGAPLGSTKNQKLVWCVCEAIKAEDQERLKSACGIALMRDERASRLSVRYKAVDADLKATTGTLGQERGFGTGSTNITAATQRIFTRMCTRFANARYSRVLPIPLPKLLWHLRHTVMCLTVDSASDEVLSGEMMRCKTLNTTQIALTPGLKYVIRDKTHASRRVISRPWAADPTLANIVWMMCRGRVSISQMIQHSKEIRRVFCRFAKTSQTKLNQKILQSK